jgi:hypothetical protein
LIQEVAAAEEDIDGIRIGDELSFADTIEEAFHDVGEFTEFVETEEARPAFDGVDGAEDTVYQFIVGISALLLQGKQVALDLAEVFARLFEKYLQDFVV